jgi:DNA-directed RNA polymerase specialized sigma24 family protein
VTQTVLLRLVGRIKDIEYDPGGNFRAWLRAVTYHAWSKFVSDRQARGQGKAAIPRSRVGSSSRFPRFPR